MPIKFKTIEWINGVVNKAEARRSEVGARKTHRTAEQRFKNMLAHDMNIHHEIMAENCSQQVPMPQPDNIYSKYVLLNFRVKNQYFSRKRWCFLNPHTWREEDQSEARGNRKVDIWFSMSALSPRSRTGAQCRKTAGGYRHQREKKKPICVSSLEKVDA